MSDSLGPHEPQHTKPPCPLVDCRSPPKPMSIESVMPSNHLILCHPLLYQAHLCMKCSLGISNFLEEISSLSHSIVFLCFFALITEEGFLISSCNSLELCIQMLISFLFSFQMLLSFCIQILISLLFTAICKASPDSHFAFLHFFSMGMVLIPVSCTMSQTSFHSLSGTLFYQI